MVSKHVLDIIIRAQDEASKVANDVNKALDGMGTAGTKSINGMNSASTTFSNALKRLGITTDGLITKYNNIKSKGTDAFNSVKTSILGVGNGITKIINQSHTLSTAMDKIKSVGGGIKDAFDSATSSISSKLDGVKNKISEVGSAVASKLSSGFDKVKEKVTSLGGQIKTKLSSAVDSVKSKVNDLANSFSGINGAISGALGAIGLGSLTQLTVGLAMTREQMTSLMQATMGSRQEAEAFIGTLDQMTDNSLVSLNDLGQAMNQIKMATGMTNDQMKIMAPVVNDIGQRAILMGKDSHEAMTLMQAAGAGLNGEFDILKNNFGITKEHLLDAGWSGAADDVAGYSEALQTCLEKGGSMDDMLQTTTGQMKLMEKGFTTAGREIGEVLLPYIQMFLEFMVKLKETNPEVYKYLILLGVALAGIAIVLPILGSIITGFGHLKDAVSGAWKLLFGTEDKAGLLSTIKEKASSAASTIKDKLSGAVQTLKDKLSGGSTGYLDLIKDKMRAVKESIQGGISKAGELAGKLKSFTADKINSLKDAFQGLADKINLARLKEIAYNIVQGIRNTLTGIWNVLLSMNPIGIVIIAIVALIAVFAYLYQNCEPVRNAIDWLWQQLQGFASWLMGGLIPIWDALVNALQPVADFIMSGLGAAWEWLMEILSGNGDNPLQFLIDGFDQLMEILGPFGEFLMSVFYPVWSLIQTVLAIIWTHVEQLIVIFQAFFDGQLSLTELLSLVWQTIFNMFVMIFQLIINTVIQWATEFVQWAINAASGFLQAIWDYISQLPGKIYMYLRSVIFQVSIWVTEFIGKAKQAGMDFVNGVINYVKDLPGKVYEEFVKIGTRIREAVSKAVEAATNFGESVKNAVLNALGIHSPGIIQESVVGEVLGTIEKIKKSAYDAGRAAFDYGKSIVDNFIESGANDVGENVLATDVGVEPTMDMSGMDTEGMAGMATAGLDIAGIFGGMGEQVTGTLANMDMANSQAFGNMLLTEQTSLNNMQMHMMLTLNAMLMYLRLGLNNAVNTNQNNLNQMLNSTKNVTSQMVSAWNVMKNSIVQAASQIQSQASDRFSKLETKIKDFYGKLQNPSRWGGSGNTSASKPSTNRRVGRPSGGMNVLSNAIGKSIVKKDHLKSFTTTSTLRASDCIDFDAIRHVSNGGNISMVDLIRGGVLQCIDPKMYAGWSKTATPNLNRIKELSRPWDAKGPVISFGSIQIPSGLAFKVRDFEDGTANYGGMDAFTKVAEAIFSRIGYDYYYDSAKTGDWLSAMATGSVNCWDGASALIALASVFGLSATMGKGHWGKDGHVWAIVNGRKFDTTGYSKGYGWTPSQSVGGSSNSSLSQQNSILESILQSSENNNQNNNSNELNSKSELEVKGKLELIHKFENLPENINEKELAKIVNESFDNDEFIKKLVNSPLFQKLDSRVKDKIRKQNNRKKGV